MGSSLLLARAIIFTLIVPGFVAVGFPSIIVRTFPSELSLGAGRYIGIILLVVGVSLYALSVFSFVIEGKGTPVIWFARPFRFVLGEEPVKLVLNGLYKMTRNPMYLGVLTFVVGEATFLQYRALFIYAICLFLFFHCVVIFIEEPHLRKKFGREYESYLESTHRWFGFR